MPCTRKNQQRVWSVWVLRKQSVGIQEWTRPPSTKDDEQARTVRVQSRWGGNGSNKVFRGLHFVYQTLPIEGNARHLTCSPTTHANVSKHRRGEEVIIISVVKSNSTRRILAIGMVYLYIPVENTFPTNTVYLLIKNKNNLTLRWILI